jgi:hypothetical protein
MADDKPTISDEQYLRAVELAIGMEFFWDSWYWPKGLEDRLKEFKAYHQALDPYINTTRGLCKIFLMMRTHQIDKPASTVIEE